jgi:hypothetical protein
MEQVKLIRLKTGEDVISYIEDYEPGKKILRSPMAVLVKLDMKTGKQTVLMDHWLPITVIKENEAVIDDGEILTSVDPSSEFSEYYENAIEALDNIKSFKSSNVSSSNEDELTEDDINLIMDTIGLVGSKTIH